MNRLIIALLVLPIVIVVIILFPITHWKRVPWKSKQASPTTVTNNIEFTATNPPVSHSPAAN